MADQYDGSVSINTELDTSGFKGGTDDLIKALERIEASINRLGETATQVLATLTNVQISAPEMPTEDQMRVPSPEMDTRDLDESTSRVQDDMNRTRNALRQPDNPDAPHMDTTDLDTSAQRVQDDMSAARDALSTELPAPTAAEMPDSAEFDRQASRMQNAISRITGEINRMVNTSAQGFRSASAVLAFSDRLDAAGDKIADAREELRAFAEQQIPTDQYTETTQAIEASERALLRLYDRRDMMEDMGVSESSAQWERLSLQIQAAEEQVERYEATADEMRETGRAFVDPKTTDEYRQMVDQLNEAEAAYQTNVGLIQQEQIEQERVNVLSAQEGVAAAATAEERQNAMRSLLEAQDQLNAVAEQSVMPAAGMGPDPEALSAWQLIADVLMDVAAQAASVVAQFGSDVLEVAAAKTIKGLAVALKGVGTAAKGAVESVRKLDGAIKGFFTHAGKGANTVDNLLKKMLGLKRMLVSRLKRTFISYLFNQITAAVKELAKFDYRFDQSISNIRNRTTELSANLVSAFGGLFRQIEPYITRILEAASNGVVRISAILASLRGETTIAVARRQTQSYAASLDDAARSAETARQAQLRLNRALTSYDELHKLGEDETTEVEVPDVNQSQTPLYENIPVEAVFTGMDEAVRDAIDDLIEAVRAGDWYGAGAAVAEGLNYIVRQIDEAILGIHDDAVRWAENIATALNGLVDNFDAAALGRTIADAINLAVDTAYAFLTTFDFGRLGERIGDAITGFLVRLNAENLGRTIAAAFNDAVAFAAGILDHTDFALFGQRVGEAINGFVDEFDIEALGRMLAAKINAVFTFALNLLTTVDFSGLGQRLAAGLNTLTDSIDAVTIGRTLVAAVNGVLDFAYEAIHNYDWSRLGEQLGNFFNQIFGGQYRISERSTREVGGVAREAFEDAVDESARGINWRRIGQLLSEGIAGVFESLASFIETADWQAVVEAIQEFLEGVDWDAIAQSMIDLLGAALGGFAGLITGALGIDDDIDAVVGEHESELKAFGDGMAQGIKEGFAAPFRNPKRWIEDIMLGPLVSAIRRVFEIASPSKKMKPYGGYIAEGVKEGIKDEFEQASITPWIEQNVRDPFYSGFNSAFSVTNGAARGLIFCGDALVMGIKTGIEAAWTFITNLLNGYVAGIQLLFLPARFLQAGMNLITGIGNGIADDNNFTTNIQNRIAARAQQIKDAFVGFVDKGKELIRQLGEGLGDEGNFTTNVANRASALAARLRGAFTGFVERGRDIVNELASGLANNLSGVDGPSTSVANRIKTALAGFVEKGQQVVADIGSGLTNNQTGVDNPSNGIAARIKNAFTTFTDTGRSVISQIGGGLTDQGNWDQKIGGPVTTRVGWIKGAFDGFVSKGKDIISQIGSGLTDQTNWDQKVGGPATTRAGWIKGAFDGFVSKGKDIISQLGGGIADLGTWNNTVGSTVLERVGWIVNGLRSGNYYDAGRYIVQGLDQGIQDEYATSRQIAANLGGVVQDAFNRAMGIGSPSRVMAEAGGYVVAGLVQGIDGESKRAYQSMHNLAEGIIREADNMEIEPEVDIAASGLDTVADKLTRIADIFSSISDTLLGFPSLPVPAVAAGAIAPAQTRVETTSSGDIREVKAMLQQFITRVTELEETTANRPIRLESTVKIDNQTLGRAIEDYNRGNRNINNGGGAW